MATARRLFGIGAGIGALALTLSGCNLPEKKTEYSGILHEDGTVVQTVYTPSRHGHGSGLGPTIDLTGDGGIGIAITHVDIHIPEKYAIVFKCQHGKFISEGKDKRHKDLWSRLQERQEVDITYREVFESVYQDKDGDGKKDLISRALVKYDFLDAQPRAVTPTAKPQ